MCIRYSPALSTPYVDRICAVPSVSDDAEHSDGPAAELDHEVVAAAEPPVAVLVPRLPCSKPIVAALPRSQALSTRFEHHDHGLQD